MTSLTLSRVGLIYQDVLDLQSTLGQNLDTLGVAFNELTYLGLAALLTLAPVSALMDLEGNAIEFEPTREGFNMLRGEKSHLLHLNVLYNSSTIRSFIHFL